MGRPSIQQVAEAIMFSARSGESDAEFDARFAGLSRLSDDELAAMGIFQPVGPELSQTACPELVEGVTKACPEPVEGVTKLTKLTTPRIPFSRVPFALRRAPRN